MGIALIFTGLVFIFIAIIMFKQYDVKVADWESEIAKEKEHIAQEKEHIAEERAACMKETENTLKKERAAMLTDLSHKTREREFELRYIKETLTEEIQENQLKLDQDFATFIETINETAQRRPILASAIADAQHYLDMGVYKRLAKESPAELNTAEEYKKIATEKKWLLQENKMLRYQLEHYEVLFPWLKEYKNLSSAEAVAYAENAPLSHKDVKSPNATKADEKQASKSKNTSSSKRRPFGDFTVYVTTSGKKYHFKYRCSNATTPLDFRSLPDHLTPCKNCVPQRLYSDRQALSPVNIPNYPPSAPAAAASSALSKIDYRNGSLLLTFTTGETYNYYNVPESVYKELLAAPSKGKFYRERIEDQYPYA